MGDRLDPDDPINPQFLILGIRLNSLGQGGELTHTQSDDPQFDAKDSDASVNVIPSPIVETPVFEDITINVIPIRPTIIYAEQGVRE